MTGVPIFAALLVASAVALALRESPHRRLAEVLPTRMAAPTRAAASPWLARLAAIAAAVALLAVVGGPIGVGLAVAVVVLGPRALTRLETRADRRRREEAERQAPLVADLLASTLAAGVPVSAALRSVAQAVGEPSAGALRRVVASLELGADAEEAWRSSPPELAPIAQAATRSARTGAPLAVLLRRIADDVARDRRRAVEVAARSAGVRAVVPLAACFLPAFLLVGVVPVVAALAGGLF